MNKTSVPADRTQTRTSRLGGWLPGDPQPLGAWLGATVVRAEQAGAPFHPVIVEFQALIENDPVLFMYFTEMFAQQSVLPVPPGSGDIKLANYHQMLVVINHVLGTAPTWDANDLVGLPIDAILEYPMATPAGLAALATPKVNAMLRQVLAVWTSFLDSPASRYVLNDTNSGWFNPAARRALQLDQFQTDPAAPYLGFRSWNDFFIREFKPGLRPVARPGDDQAIVSACEAQPYSIRTHVKKTDTFWVKAQPYSLQHLLAGHHVDEFVGGTIYQAFLSAKNYHRWHSPVSGTIVQLEQIAGTYYAEAASEGFDAFGPKNSQGYLAHVATRALIFIQADNPVIGLLCLVPVGMAEVSSCRFRDGAGEPLRVGQHVNKGDQVGYFQFGGSSHCLVFRPNVIGNFAAQALPHGENGADSCVVPIKSLLATAA